MITKIAVKPESATSEILFFKEADFSQFKSRVIPLFGPNGVGKSTLLESLVEGKLYANTDKPTKFFAYMNSTDNFKHREAKTIHESFDPLFLAAKFNSQSLSEGQSIIYSMYDLLDCFKLNGEIEPEDDLDYVLLLDEIDSGMSIDNIDTTMRKIRYLLRIRSDLQFVMSFNSPRILKYFPHVLSMYDGTMIELHTDEDMVNEIRKHKKVFNKARKTSKGRPKVFV